MGGHRRGAAGGRQGVVGRPRSSHRRAAAGGGLGRGRSRPDAGGLRQALPRPGAGGYGHGPARLGAGTTKALRRAWRGWHVRLALGVDEDDALGGRYGKEAEDHHRCWAPRARERCPAGSRIPSCAKAMPAAVAGSGLEHGKGLAGARLASWLPIMAGSDCGAVASGKAESVHHASSATEFIFFSLLFQQAIDGVLCSWPSCSCLETSVADNVLK
ncbi:hypothetical protein ZWY2020_029913 [Hordeum vulgare]|nr:hypothetical protein ZWY2020_029913 [Hordeum vulgare]